jgi:hypothetical protein
MLRDITRATGQGFCVSQLPLMVFVILYYNEPHAILYTTQVTNHTKVTADIQEVGFSALFLVLSGLCAVFSLMTTQLQESQLIDNMLEYNEENISQMQPWNNVIWTVVLLSRTILVSLLCSPVDLFFVGFVVSLQAYSILLICHPRDKRTVGIVLFMLVAGFVFANMHSTKGLKVVFWTIQTLGDVLLMVGHTYDVQCNMETVANSRIFYCCFASGLALVLYIT